MNNILKLIALCFLFIISTAYSNLDKALSIWGSKLSFQGFDNPEKYEAYAKAVLKHHGLYVPITPYTTSFNFSLKNKSLNLKVISLKTNSLLFNDSIKLEDLSPDFINRAIRKTINTFSDSLPYKALVYAKKNNFVKINKGKNGNITVGQDYLVIRYEGEASRKIDLTEDFPFATVGSVRITETKRYKSIARILTNNGIKKLDKLILKPVDYYEPQKNKHLEDKTINEKSYSPNIFKFHIGSAVGNQKVSSNVESDLLEPDQDKTLKYESPVPIIATSFTLQDKWELGLEWRWRKIPLTLASGSKIKATYNMLSFDLSYNVRGEAQNWKPLIGYFCYSNKVSSSLIRYISVSYHGPHLGVQWHPFDRAPSAYLKFSYAPYLLVSEDQVKRGSSAKAYSFYTDIGYTHWLEDKLKNFGVTVAFNYRYLKTSFSGTVNQTIIPEDTEYSENLVGFKLMLSSRFFL